MAINFRLKPRLRLLAIYSELGYNPWRRPRKPRKSSRGEKKGVYMGARENIPFLNDDAKRTFSHLLFRPGFMMRDYVLRGQHERYLAPFTALLVFYSVFTLLLAVVNPGVQDSVADDLLRGFQEAAVHADSARSESGSLRLSIHSDSTDKKEISGPVIETILNTMAQAILLTRLDLHPDAADTPWKESLAAIEGDLRGKGIPLFLGNFLLMWAVLSILLRRRGTGISGAAAVSAYVLCQFCIFMFLALIFSFGKSSGLGVLLMGVLLFIDYRQMLGLRTKPALRLTVRTGLLYLAFLILFYALVGTGLILFALTKV